LGFKLQILLECDSGSSVITAIEAQRGIILTIPVVKPVAENRLRHRPVTGITNVLPVGIVRAKNRDVTLAGEKFCEMLRKAINEGSKAR
jgi:DNA-binding transcriptional LysR family regulator